MKVKLEVDDNEFPEIPQFPKHLVLMWSGIREQMIQKLPWFVVMMPPIFPLFAMLGKQPSQGIHDGSLKLLNGRRVNRG